MVLVHVYSIATTPKIDPTLPRHQIIRLAKGEYRKKNNLETRGKAKLAMTPKHIHAQEKHVTLRLTSYDQAHIRYMSASSLSSTAPSSPVPSSSLSSSPIPDCGVVMDSEDQPSQKRRRLSQDKYIVLQAESCSGVESEGTGRQKSVHHHFSKP